MGKFLIGLFAGGFLGVAFMCMCSIVDDIDELAEMMKDQPETTEEEELEE